MAGEKVKKCINDIQAMHGTDLVQILAQFFLQLNLDLAKLSDMIMILVIVPQVTVRSEYNCGKM